MGAPGRAHPLGVSVYLEHYEAARQDGSSLIKLSRPAIPPGASLRPESSVQEQATLAQIIVNDLQNPARQVVLLLQAVE